MADKRVRESWEKYGPRGREVVAFVELMDSMSHDQWIVVGETAERREFDEYVDARQECMKIGIPVVDETILSSLGDDYRPQYDKDTVSIYMRGQISGAKSVAPLVVGIADRLPVWAVEVLLRPFVKAGVDLSAVLPDGMDISHPLPRDDDDDSSGDGRAMAVEQRWEKYGPRGRQVEVFVGLMDSMSHDQWVVVGKTPENRDSDEFAWALEQCLETGISATTERMLIALGDCYQPQYDDEAVGWYTRRGVRGAKSIAPYIVGIADRLPAWAVEVLLRPFVKAGVDLSAVLPEGMDISSPLPDEA